MGKPRATGATAAAPGRMLLVVGSLIIAPTARKQLAEQLPESVAFATYEFIIGPLLDNPHGVGKRLLPPLHDRHSARRGTYRVIYRIDDERQQVTVVGVFSHADAYRAR
jgi:mRNA interferase RelE/StbE